MTTVSSPPASVATTDQQANYVSVAPTNSQANSALLRAATNDDEEEAIFALSQPGVDVNCRSDVVRWTPLQLACYWSRPEKLVARRLSQDCRVDVNATNDQGQTAMHILDGHGYQSVHDLLSQRMHTKDWNIADKIGQTPLLWKARTASPSFEWLLQVKSVDIHAKTIDKFTALHQLAERGSHLPDWAKKQHRYTRRCALVALFLKELQTRGENVVSFVDKTDILDRSALHYIADEGCIDILKLLLDKCFESMNVNGVDFHGFTPLHLAVRKRHDGVVKRLLQEQRVDANVRATVNASDPEGLKPFETNPNQLNLCRPNLFDKKPEKESSGELTPLHFAAKDGSTEIVKLLLEREGINVAPKDTKGFTPLDYSVQNGHLDVVKLLLEKGEPITPLNYDAQRDMFEKLLDSAPQCDDKEAIAIHLLNALGSRLKAFAETKGAFSSDQSRLLALAARNNHSKLIRYIVMCEQEIDVNEKSEWVVDQGLVATPLHFATLGQVAGAPKGHLEAIKELLNLSGLEVNTRDNKQNTPLLYAIDAGNVDVVKALCHDNRLRATEENSDGRTPLQIVAEKNDHPNMKAIEKVLLDRPDVKDFVDRLYRDRQVFVDAANALLVGAALIASVTFAGWLQPPQGYTTYYDFSQPLPAPPGTYESYAAIKQNPKVKAFWVFNSLSFFFAIATVLAGADAAMPSLDNAFIGRVVKSVRRALIVASILLVMSVVCVLGAFASAGFAVLPPLLIYDTSMIITICVGGTVCVLILAKFLWKLATPIRTLLTRKCRAQ